ncbi:MAG: U32 family peptidase [bacterium]|nr:U32 family peptidase [bacterium]
MGKDRVPELLAPAGNPEAFYAAVNAGADAVYLGATRFGARAYAENFTAEEILRCIRYGHLFGKKIYLTVNTLMREPELTELYDCLYPAYEAGLDAVIVQDFGALRRIREWFPDLRIHASTQMTLCSSFGAEMLRGMGASRIVPARELSLEELRVIRSQTDIELETFVHGAMCYCYSGQCLFSSILGGRSGNRGRCAQPCRLPYRVRTKDGTGREGYYLSLKDLCTVEHLPELIEAGIDSFKIEGRMKRPEYTAGVTAIYRSYMDRYLQLSEKFGKAEAAERFSVEREDVRKLNTLYIRSEVQDGYYFRRNGPEMITLKDPSYKKCDEELLCAIHDRYLTEQKKLPVFMEACFRTGEPASLTLQCKDINVTVSGGAVEAARKQPVTEENIRRQLGKLGDSVFALQKLELTADGDAFYPLKQINELRREGIRRLEEEILRSRGYGTFSAVTEKAPESADCESDATAESAPDGEWRFRDTAAEGADCGRNIGVKGNPQSAGAAEAFDGNRSTSKGYSILLETEEQLCAAAAWLKNHPNRKLSGIYVSGELVLQGGEEIRNAVGELAGFGPLLLALPYILRRRDEKRLTPLLSLAGEGKPFAGYLVRSADGLGFLRGADKRALRQLDANVYTWNRAAAVQLAQAGATGFCLPLELTAAQQRALLKGGVTVSGTEADFEKIVYGRIPMMITANCLLHTTGKCLKGKESRAETVLIDRYRKEFPVAVNCKSCFNVIYNSVPLSLASECAEWESRVRLRINFTVESGEESVQILDAFLADGRQKLPAHTTGHERRGVE